MRIAIRYAIPRQSGFSHVGILDEFIIASMPCITFDAESTKKYILKSDLIPLKLPIATSDLLNKNKREYSKTELIKVFNSIPRMYDEFESGYLGFMTDAPKFLIDPMNTMINILANSSNSKYISHIHNHDYSQ